MGKEKCWRCHKLRSDVDLRSTDDRLCEPCFRKNEEELAVVRRRDAEKKNTLSSGQEVRADAGPAFALDGVEDEAVAAGLLPKIIPSTVGQASSKPAPTETIALPALSSLAVDPIDNCRVAVSQQACEDLMCRVDQLTTTVARQNEIISNLSCQLTFVLSFLGIQQDDCDQLRVSCAILPSASKPVSMGAMDARDGQSHDTAEMTTTVRPQTATKSFVDVVRESVRSVSHEAKNRNDIVAAMYVEQNHKAKRANSFIISGLSEDEHIPDNNLVENLCCDEFGLSIRPSSCKRIGRQLMDKPRHLLVYVKSQTEADTIIQSAKKLRKSDNSYVRTNVFINPNLTKAEAKAQFELRQQRRQRNAVHRTEHGNASPPSAGPQSSTEGSSLTQREHRTSASESGRH